MYIRYSVDNDKAILFVYYTYIVQDSSKIDFCITIQGWNSIIIMVDRVKLLFFNPAFNVGYIIRW